MHIALSRRHTAIHRRVVNIIPQAHLYLYTFARITQQVYDKVACFIVQSQLLFSSLLLHEIFHPAQPRQIFFLLLDIDVVWDEHGKLSVDSSCIEVLLEHRLNFFIELLEWWADVGVLVGILQEFGGAG